MLNSASPLPGDARHVEVLCEQTRLLFRHLPFILGGNVMAALGVVVVLWQWEPHGILLCWIGAVCSLSIARFWIYRIFERNSRHFDPAIWVRRAIFLSGMSGALWGTTGVLLFQPEPMVVMTLVIVLGGMAAGSVSAHSCYLPAYVVYATLAILPFAIRCMLENELFFIVLGGLSLTFLAVNINYGRNLQKNIVETIRLQFKNAELIAALTKQKEVAEQANLAKTRFLAAASHDLRQPVQAIELFVDALSRDLLTHPSRKLLDRIGSAGRSLESLLNALLDFSKIDAAVIAPEKRNFSLTELFRQLQDYYTPQTQGCDMDLRFAPTRAWLYTDPALLERILRNFISNALKYTPSGKVLVGCRRRGGTLRIEVHDTGIGIPAQSRQEVFREFSQLDNPERDREKGLGLGLFIADGLARSLGHPLELQSEIGRGSSFSITVPLGVAEGTGSQSTIGSVCLGSLWDKTVLFIDDDASIREGAAETMERWGCAVVTAESAAEALELMRVSGFVPDAMLVDYRLRNNETGVAAIRAVQSRWGNVPAAILTGDTAPDRLREARAAGYPLMHKPLTAAKLRALLSHLLTEAAT